MNLESYGYCWCFRNIEKGLINKAYFMNISSIPEDIKFVDCYIIKNGKLFLNTYRQWGNSTFSTFEDFILCLRHSFKDFDKKALPLELFE